MKIYVHYEDHSDTSLHKTSKLTVPSSWAQKTVQEVMQVQWHKRILIASKCLTLLIATQRTAFRRCLQPEEPDQRVECRCLPLGESQVCAGHLFMQKQMGRETCRER